MGNEAKLIKVSLIFLLLFFLLVLCTASCNTVDPPPDKTVLTLTLEDVSCTEAWIQLTTNNLQLPATINLLKDNNITKTINLQAADTLLYIDSLLPNQTYNFKLSGIGNPASGINSNEISVTTMDTTSHNFTFQTWTFGTIGSSSLYDVAIISDNNIWCVGEILVADSSPNGYTTYCYLKWNGNEWELGKLKYFPPGSTGDSITTSGRSVFAFSEDDVWISGGAVFHWNGSSWKIYYNTGAEGSNKIWGTSSNNLYFVGRNGNIIHYNGNQWKKIESGTTAEVKDIWGSIYPVTGEKLLLCTISNQFEPGDRKIIRINAQGVLDSLHWLTDRRASSIWFLNQRKLFVCGGGVFIQRLDGMWVEQTAVPLYYTYRIRGVANNDLFVAGGFGLITHYNGVDWRVWENLGALIWYSAAYSDGMFVTVGQTSNQAIIGLMRR